MKAKIKNSWARAKSAAEILRSRYRLYGPLWFLSRIAKRLFYLGAWALLLPITLVLHAVGFRRLTIYPDRIGHLAVEIDGFLKEQRLGNQPKHRYFVLSLPGRIANPCLLHDYWSRLIPVVRQPIAVYLLDIMSSRWLMRHELNRMVLTRGGTSALYALYAAWGSREPLLRLKDNHKKRGTENLRKLGLPNNAWFVCIHTREPGFSPVDEMQMDFRNAEPLRLIASIEEIIRRGGFCVHMGDESNKPFPAMKGLIDYPRSGMKSDWMDIFLCAECRFFLGANSGLHFVSNIFGRPVAVANLAPLGTLPPCPGDIGIPKFAMREGAGTVLPFAEALSLPSACYQRTAAFKQDKITLIENDAADIQDLTIEMLDRLDECWKEDPEDEKLQTAYRALFKGGHFSYGSQGRIGSAFLRKYRQLLDL